MKNKQKQPDNQHEKKSPVVSAEVQKLSDKEKGNSHTQKEDGRSNVASRQWQPTTKEREANGRVGHSK